MPSRDRRPALPSDEKFTGERVERAFESLRREDVYELAKSCEACGRERLATSDETALCEAHLARVLSPPGAFAEAAKRRR
jgi:hypothetical protein